jgi:hypothetical protein
MKPLKILFFTNGPAPTAEQLAEANKLTGHICFRNAKYVPAEPHALEECDGVAGDVPAIYSAEYPDAVSAIEARDEKIAELSASVGDSPAPRKPKGDKDATAPKPQDTPAPKPPAQGQAPAAGWQPQGQAPAGSK